MVEILKNILTDSWSVLGDMAPFLLFGFFVAGVLSVIIKPELIEKHLSGKGILPILKSTMFGIPLPLCSCGVIPVAASLRKHGASKGATAAFLLSTPQTGVDSILVTYSLLGGVFAIFRPIMALFSGMFGGSLVDIVNPSSDGKPVKCEDECCNPKNKNEDSAHKIYRMFKYAFITLPADIAGPLLIGLLAAGIISALVPDDYFASILGGGITAMVVMMLLGLPVYVCATASVPVAAVLIGKGVSPGAAFAFLMTGPATNAATIAVIWKMLGKGTTVIYLLTVAVLAMAGGMTLDYIFNITQASPGSATIWMPSVIIKTVSSVALLVMLAAAYINHRSKHRELHLDAGGKITKLKITGMICNHCAESVRKGLLEIDGVDDVVVNLKQSQADIAGKSIDADKVRAKIESLGYKLVSIKEGERQK